MGGGMTDDEKNKHLTEADKKDVSSKSFRYYGEEPNILNLSSMKNSWKNLRNTRTTLKVVQSSHVIQRTFHVVCYSSCS